MPEPRHQRGLIDTSVLIDLDDLPREALPREPAISVISLAELAAGPHAVVHPGERARRQDRLVWVEAVFPPLPFDAAAARAYGLVFAEVMSAGRKPRGRRAVDLFIAATALAHRIPLYTRNPDDFAGLERLVTVVAT